MADFQETIKLAIDDVDYVAAITRDNALLSDMERKTILSNANMGSSFDALAKKVLSSKQSSQSAINNIAKQSELRAIFSGTDEIAKIQARTKLALFQVRGDVEATSRVAAAGKQELLNYAKSLEEVSKASNLFSRNTATGRGFLAAKDLFEGRTSYAQVEALTAVSKLSSSTAVGIAGITIGLVALTATAIKSAESLGKFAAGQKDIQDRTGLSADQLGQFAFAAKAVNADIDITERLMRGLTLALTDNSAAGDKARKTLQALGVSPLDFGGNLKAPGELLLEISDGLAKLPAGSQKFKDLIDLFKRMGIEAGPFLDHLRENTEYFKANGVASPSQKDLDSWNDYNKLVDIAETKVANFFRAHVTAPLASLGANLVEGLAGNPEIVALQAQLAEKQEAASKVSFAGFGASGLSVSGFGGTAISRARSGLAGAISGDEGIEAAQNKLELLKTAYDTALGSAEQLQSSNVLDLSKYKAATVELNRAADAYQRQKDLVSQLESVESARTGFAKKAADDLYSAEQKLADLRAGEANKERAFDGRATNVAKELARYKDEVAQQSKAQGLPEASIAAKLAPAHTALLTAAALEDTNIRRKYAIEESEYEANLRTEKSEKQFQRDVEISDQLRELRTNAQKQAIQFEDTLAQESRDRQLRAIENTDAKTLQAKVSYILQAAQIESEYDLKAATVKAKLDADDTQRKIDAVQAQFHADQMSATLAGKLIGDLHKKQALDDLELGITTADQIAASSEQAQIKAQEAVRDAYTKEFDSLKSGISRLFESFGSKGGIGKFFKTSLMDVLKEVVSTQGARLALEAETGQHVGLTGATPATGTLGKILQFIGFGTKPTFPDLINQSNHLGTALLINTPSGNALPVYVANHEDIRSGGGGSGINIGGGGGFARPGLLTRGSPLAATIAALALGLGGGGAATAGTIPSVSSAISFGSDIGSGGAFTGGFGSPGLSGSGGGFGGGGGFSLLSLAGGGGGGGGGGSDISSAGAPGGDLSSLPGFGASGGGPFSLGSLSGVSGGGGGGGGGVGSGGGSLAGLGGLAGGGIGAALGGLLGHSGTSAGVGGILGGILGTFGGKALGTSLGKSSISALAKSGLSGLEGLFTSKGALTSNVGSPGYSGGVLGVLGSPAVTSIGLGLLGSSYINPLGRPLASGVQGGVGGALAGFGIGSKIPGVGGLNGALIGVGASELSQGIIRGGAGGAVQDVFGGAAAGAGVGNAVGGPIGALIGAGVGAAAGGLAALFRGTFKTASQTAQSKAQSIFGVKITDQALLGQLVQLANSQFNGDITTMITSPQGRQLIQLYAQSTGQKSSGILATPQAAIFANQGSKLTELPTYFNGQPVYPGQTQTTIGNPVISPTGIPLGYSPVPGGANTAQVQSISLDAEATTALLQGQAVQTMQNNPRIVSSAASVGQTESATQRYSAVNTLAPTQLLS